jgi:hypothetical protein
MPLNSCLKFPGYNFLQQFIPFSCKMWPAETHFALIIYSVVSRNVLIL